MKNLTAVTGFLIILTLRAMPVDLSSDSKKLDQVILPAIADEGMVNPIDCLDVDIYADTLNLQNIKEESDYLCAYIAFQANKEQNNGVGLYSSKEEADYRYVCFKKSIDRVNTINSFLVDTINSGNYGWEAGVNFFSDMTPFETSRYLGFGRLPNINMPDNCVDPIPDSDPITLEPWITKASSAPRTTPATTSTTSGGNLLRLMERPLQ